MTDPPALGTGSRLTFHGPLSGDRADRLVAELVRSGPATVLDAGCGWGELLLRVIAAAPTARGSGIDIRAADLARARANAVQRGLADRVAFVEGPAADHLGPADLILCNGAYHAFGSIDEALAVLRASVNPGGRLLFGADIWDRPPTAGELANMWPGITADDCTDLAGLVDKATAAGFRPLRIETATRGEWEEFESGYGAELEEWLLGNAEHPEADQVRAKVDGARSIWLRGHRDVMGFGYLTLGVPGP